MKKLIKSSSYPGETSLDKLSYMLGDLSNHITEVNRIVNDMYAISTEYSELNDILDKSTIPFIQSMIEDDRPGSIPRLRQAIKDAKYL